MVIDRERLRRTRERADAATPRPWRVGPWRGFGDEATGEHDVEDAGGEDLAGVRGMFHRRADAEFVAHAREDVPALVEALKGVLEASEGLQDRLEDVVSPDPGGKDGLVFAGTGEPVRDLVEHLKSGNPLNDFTDHRATAVTKEQTVALLEAGAEAVGLVLGLFAKDSPSGESTSESTSETGRVEEEARDVLTEAERRGARMRFELVGAEGGAVDSARFGKLLGRIDEQEVEDLREAGEVLAFPVGCGEHLYPLWQVRSGAPMAGLPEVLGSFGGVADDPWMQATFFLSPEPRLDGRRPLDVLREGRVRDVAEAASAYGEHVAR